MPFQVLTARPGKRHVPYFMDSWSELWLQHSGVSWLRHKCIQNSVTWPVWCFPSIGNGKWSILLHLTRVSMWLYFDWITIMMDQHVIYALVDHNQESRIVKRLNIKGHWDSQPKSVHTELHSDWYQLRPILSAPARWLWCCHPTARLNSRYEINQWLLSWLHSCCYGKQLRLLP